MNLRIRRSLLVLFLLAAVALLQLVMLLRPGPAPAHRLSGHPRSLQGRIALAKRQVAHDRHARHAGDHWLSHDFWLRYDLRRVRELRAQLNPRWSVDGCLRAIIDRENPSWNPRRWNTAGSGAYGLPQANPASKMRTAGSDYMTNPWTQIRWMLGYVNGRYGGSCAAWAFWQAHSWY